MIATRSPSGRERRATPPGSSERGLTLTELTIVGVMATMVMLALTGFYFNSQRMWIDGSTQAMAQRDATLLVDELRRRVHEAEEAAVDPTDPDHDRLTLAYAQGVPGVQFEWNEDDGRVHLRVDDEDLGAIVESPVKTFRLSTIGSTMVELTLLDLRSASGDSVQVSSKFALLGRGQP